MERFVKRRNYLLLATAVWLRVNQHVCCIGHPSWLPHSRPVKSCPCEPVDYYAGVNAAYNKTEPCHWSWLQLSKWSPAPLLPLKVRGWMASILVGTALILLTGCQSAPRANPPPFPSTPSMPSAPSAPPQVTVTPTAPSRQTLTAAAWKAEANRWLGVKYRKGGTDRTGIDCSGLTSQMYLALAGVALPRTSQDQSRYGKPVSRKDLQPGVLIFFSSLRRHLVDHVGIYLGETQFVHASPSKGVVVSSLLREYYMRRYHSARRVVP